ncbi:acyl-CoA thioesterase [Lujinxingia litoralis]|uniref:Acyl-CoA thioesterase n=2 Tax=Lujinxingia litoralis TaxID=2211119 RepID=A0A328CCB1_9DELT|nr:acyl-CoA thioesterase [Lujinxingia litoralis]
MTSLMTPDLVNFSGKVHGGALLKLLDQVAYSCAARYCGHYVVTLLLDDALFRAPVHVGELVTFRARVNWVGRTSIEVGVRVESEDHHTRAIRHVLSCFFVMIAMDDQGTPVEVTPFDPEDPTDQRRWAAAEERRRVRRSRTRRNT